MEATKSLYERYKYCDKYAVTWFVATARAHKAIEDLLETVSTVSTTDVGLGSGRLSGKARKRAKAAKLVDKEPQLMLKSLQPCTLDESIRLRTVYGLCVQGSAPTGADEVADSRHRYFISVLQNVRQLLGQLPLAAGPSISAGPVPNNGYSAMNLGDQPGEQQLEVDLQERQQFLDSIEGLDPSEITIRRVFTESILQNEAKMAELASRFGRVLGSQGIVMPCSGDLGAVVDKIQNVAP
ncbi:hypothetical protein QBC42DRAFT_283808 [Cladorrhinum samala]|uniref:DUF6604 domain-containing protein n=1 Tax=Cladorrhinum samala TaxID=585594 RepID=A0AAV9HYB2_9PEZI|nr:hypothetical protein QBC42DRAFT_283808 [Cladorrhinum samala]